MILNREQLNQIGRLIPEAERLMLIAESSDRAAYLKWKRLNVTYRGFNTDIHTENGGGAILGAGLYSASLSNKAMAKSYGDVYFAVNARPKNPIKFKTMNAWEIWFYNTLVFAYSKAMGKTYPDRRDFSANTTVEAEVQKLGYDGVEIIGREMVNYKPEDVRYFKTEQELIDFYNSEQR